MNKTDAIALAIKEDVERDSVSYEINSELLNQIEQEGNKQDYDFFLRLAIDSHEEAQLIERIEGQTPQSRRFRDIASENLRHYEFFKGLTQE